MKDDISEMNQEEILELIAPRFRVYIVRGRVLLYLNSYDTIAEAIAYCKKHKKDCFWIMDFQKMTMRHSSSFIPGRNS